MKTTDGPVAEMVVPAPKKRPIPIVPPIAIICTWRLDRERMVPSLFSILSAMLRLLKFKLETKQ